MKRKLTSQKKLKDSKQLQDLLKQAIREDNVEALEGLVEQGANIDTPNLRGALHEAASIGSVNVFQYIMENGRHHYHKKQLALFDAARKGQIKIVKLLIDEYKIKYINAVHIAAEKGHIEVIKLFIENDNSLIAADCNGKNLLQKAICYKQEDIIRLLLEEYNVDPNESIDKISPWEYSVCSMLNGSEKSINIAKLLLKHGVDINQIIETYLDHNITALIEAICSRKVNIVEFLLLNGANANHVDEDLNSGIHQLASGYSLGKVNEQEFMEMVKLLVQYGCETDKLNEIKSKYGKTPKDYLKKKGEKALNTYYEAIASGLQIREDNKKLLEQILKYITYLADLPYLPSEVIEKIVEYTDGIGRKINTEEVAILKALSNKKRNQDASMEVEENSTTNDNSYDENDKNNSDGETTENNTPQKSINNCDNSNNKEQENIENGHSLYIRQEDKIHVVTHACYKEDDLPGMLFIDQVFAWMKELPEWLREWVISYSTTQRLIKEIYTANKLLENYLSNYLFGRSDKLSDGTIEEESYNVEEKAKVKIEASEEFKEQGVSNQDLIEKFTVNEDEQSIKFNYLNNLNGGNYEIEERIKALLSDINSIEEDVLSFDETLVNDHLSYWV
ncbi:ankyrin repeat domain-containing protein [Candidatus Jidaibacter acanthamoebae]|nr:ankyrin repeat domain-containing protein [Candidatus Jidaibacter acanthamoeba]